MLKNNKNTMFKQMIQSRETIHILESHNGISAKIAEKSGFQAVWGSSLTISASKGLRDCNEVSHSEICQVASEICEAIDIPLLLDIDTGYGNFNNARLLVARLAKAGVSAVCIEDKVFPKMNSFVTSNTTCLENTEVFCKKIMAMKEAVDTEDFLIIARTEAFINKRGDTDEALRRAKAYHAAGADAIFVHSKIDDFSDISGFMEVWGDRCPIVIAPTTYANTTKEQFEDAGISIVICTSVA